MHHLQKVPMYMNSMSNPTIWTQIQNPKNETKTFSQCPEKNLRPQDCCRQIRWNRFDCLLRWTINGVTPVAPFSKQLCKHCSSCVVGGTNQIFHPATQEKVKTANRWWLAKWRPKAWGALQSLLLHFFFTIAASRRSSCGQVFLFFRSQAATDLKDTGSPCEKRRVTPGTGPSYTGWASIEARPYSDLPDTNKIAWKEEETYSLRKRWNRVQLTVSLKRQTRTTTQNTNNTLRAKRKQTTPQPMPSQKDLKRPKPAVILKSKAHPK